DDDLVERFRAGERDAFDELVRRYQRPIYYLARRYLKNDEDAKDITQRAFVKAFQRVAQLRGQGAFRSWLYRIATNLALNHLRDPGRGRPPEAAGLTARVEPVGTSRMAGEENHARLRTAIAKLPPKQRLVLELRVFDELPFRDVAEAAGCTENAA